MKSVIIAELLICAILFCGAKAQVGRSTAAPEEYKAADAELNSVYKKILAEYGSDTLFIRNLKKAQRLWIQFRDAEVAMKYPKREKGQSKEARSKCISAYLTQLTNDRTATLKIWLDGDVEENICNGSVKARITVKVLPFDSTTWEISGSAVEMENGNIRLQSSTPFYPYYRTKENPFPSAKNFTMKLSFQYPKPAVCGVGLAIGDSFPQAEITRAEDKDRFNITKNAIVSFWQDAGLPLAVFFMGNPIYSGKLYDRSIHTIELQYDGKYRVSVDKELIYTSPPTQTRPSSICFGNPYISDCSEHWPILELQPIVISSQKEDGQTNN